MYKRIRQFFSYMFYKLNEQDMEYIDKKLNGEIKNIFNKLSSYEKKHSVLVAQAVEKENENDKDLVLAALLHDIGKTNHHLNIIKKSVIVLLDYLTKGKLKKINGIKCIYIFYNHGEIGYGILRGKEYNERVLLLIRDHHNKKIDSADLAIIRKFDDKY